MSVASPPVQPAQNQPQGSSRPDYGEPTVATVFGALCALTTACVAVLGLTTVCSALAGTTAVISSGLLLSRRGALKQAEKYQVSNPAGSATKVVGIIIALAALAVAAPVLIRVFDVHLAVDHHKDRLWPIRGIAISTAVVCATVHLSAIMDWAIIGLRLKGVLGDWTMPCQRTADWTPYTRLWLAHRVATNLIFRMGVAAIIGFVAALIIHIPSVSTKATKGAGTIDGKTLAAIVVPLVATLLVFFLNRFLPVWSLVLNPRLSVGDEIVLAEEYGTGIKRRPRYYVVDVANEGAKLLELEGGKPKGGGAEHGGREHDRSLDLIDIPRLLRRQGHYEGCVGTCSMANHHCPVGVGLPVSSQPAVATAGTTGQPPGLPADGLVGQGT